MKKLIKLFYTSNYIMRSNYFLFFASIVITIFFINYQVRHKSIDLNGKMCSTIWADDAATPLAYNQITDNRKNNIPTLISDSALAATCYYLVKREDPRLFDQNYILGDFWNNYRGVSLKRTFRFGGAGASTVGQQVPKCLANPLIVVDNSRRTVFSKLGEICTAFKMSFSYTPQQILQLYANVGDFGSHKFGGLLLNTLDLFRVNNLQELNPYQQYIIARSATGAYVLGIDYTALKTAPKSQTDSLFSLSFRYALIRNKKASEEELRSVLSYPLNFRTGDLGINNKPYLLDILNPLADSLKRDGLQYITSLQKKYCGFVDSAFAVYRAKNKSEFFIGDDYVLSANAVVMRMSDGAVIGINTRPLVTPHEGSVNNKIFAQYPVASLIKPLLVASGIEEGYLTANTILLDKQMGRGRIHNYNDRYWGTVSLGFTLKKSLNTPIDNSPYRNRMVSKSEDVMHTFFGSELKPLPGDYSPSNYVLGEPRELGLVQIASVYRSFLHNGNAVNSKIIQKVVDANVFPFDSVYQVDNRSRRIFSQATVNAMQQLLQEPLQEGGTLEQVARTLNSNVGVMGKSATSDKYQVGYTVLANDRYLVAVRMCYQPLNNKNKSFPPIPTKSGAGSAGIIAGSLFNLINN